MSDDPQHDRPSISALQQFVAQVGADYPAIASAVPVLLEIVAAALAMESARAKIGREWEAVGVEPGAVQRCVEAADATDKAMVAFRTALTKVLP